MLHDSCTQAHSFRYLAINWPYVLKNGIKDYACAGALFHRTALLAFVATVTAPRWSEWR